MEKKRKPIVQVLICIGLLCAIWGGYFFLEELTDRRLKIYEDDLSWVYQIDSLEVEGRSCVLRGFAFRLEEDSVEGYFEIVLHELESGKNYFPKMEYMRRADVDEYFACEYDYLNSGFEASISANRIKLQERNYEILLRMEGRRRTYRTGIYLSKGEIVYANPTEFEAPSVEGTVLEDVVENGVLRLYRPDYGIYVYQYEGELYWIADTNCEFDDGGNLHIPYHLDTTQVEKLPEERLENQWYWDNISFWFNENELVDVNTGNYRVTKKKIPTAYPVEKMWTGRYQGEWIWKQYFRPYYDFGE